MKEQFTAVINCIDGRIQGPVISYMKKKYGVKYVTMITEPGPDKVLSENKEAPVALSIERKIGLSVSRQGAKIIAVAGDYDCAGNPADEKTHKEQLIKAVVSIKQWDCLLMK